MAEVESPAHITAIPFIVGSTPSTSEVEPTIGDDIGDDGGLTGIFTSVGVAAGVATAFVFTGIAGATLAIVVVANAFVYSIFSFCCR
jgi:hypothetical protein